MDQQRKKLRDIESKNKVDKSERQRMSIPVKGSKSLG